MDITVTLSNLTRTQVRERLQELEIRAEDLIHVVGKEVVFVDGWDIGKAMVVSLPHPTLVTEDGRFCRCGAQAYPVMQEVWDLYNLLTQFDEVEEAICMATMENVPLSKLGELLTTLTTGL